MVRLWVAVSQLLSRVSITQSRNTFWGIVSFPGPSTSDWIFYFPSWRVERCLGKNSYLPSTGNTQSSPQEHWAEGLVTPGWLERRQESSAARERAWRQYLHLPATAIKKSEQKHMSRGFSHVASKQLLSKSQEALYLVSKGGRKKTKPVGSRVSTVGNLGETHQHIKGLVLRIFSNALNGFLGYLRSLEQRHGNNVFRKWTGI